MRVKLSLSAPDHNSKQRGSAGLTALLMVLLIACTVIATLWWQGIIRFADEPSYRRQNMTDAVFLCQQEAREQFAERLQVMEIDDLSSRSDSRDRRLKIFINAYLFDEGKRSGPTTLYYVNCFTRMDKPEVTRFDYSEDRDAPTKVGREGPDTENPFGFPR